MIEEPELFRLRIKLAAIEALLPGTDEEFPIFPYQIREALGYEPGEFLLIRKSDIKLVQE